jgi:hypothetical protein
MSRFLASRFSRSGHRRTRALAVALFAAFATLAAA